LGGGFFDVSVFPTQRILLNWDQFQSPDYFTSACTQNYYGVPNNIFGNKYAKQGNAYAGFMLYYKPGDTKEYICQQLTSPLQMGKTYCLSFFVSRANRKEYAIKNIGAYFSVSQPTLVSSLYINAIPQVINQSGFLVDTTQWAEIQGCFIAQGGEQYITIGNFNSNANTDTLYTGTSNSIPSDPEYAYYYIDNVILIDQTTVGVNEFKEGDGLEIYPNPTNSILNITANNLGIQNSLVEIRNVLGETVISTMFANQINVSELTKGVYFLTLKNRTYKFVKQ
jgi:hypothetical protein